MAQNVASIDYEELCPFFRIRPMRVRMVRDLVACSRPQSVFPSILQLGHKLSFQNEDHMTAIAPMIRAISRSIFHDTNADAARFNGLPRSFPRFSRMLRFGDGIPIRGKKSDILRAGWIYQYFWSPKSHHGLRKRTAWAEVRQSFLIHPLYCITELSP